MRSKQGVRNMARLFMILLGVVLTVPAAAWAQQPGVQTGSANFSPLTTAEAQNGPYVQQFDNGSIDWATGRVTAVGIGVAPPNAVSPGQARAMAKRAATEIARRNLLEIIKGVNIDSSTTVRNYMVTDDTVVSEVRGFLKYSLVSDPAYMSDGTIEVTAMVDLRGSFAQAIMPKTMPFKSVAPMQPIQEAAPAPAPQVMPAPQPVPAPAPAPEPEAEVPAINEQNLAAVSPQTISPGVPTAAYSGLVIDARGLGARPAMSPKILSMTGEEVYGSASVSRQYAIEQGVAGYARGLETATANPRVSGNPLVIKAVDVAGQAGTDLVISEPQAERLKALAGADFLEKCRVMIVLD